MAIPDHVAAEPQTAGSLVHDLSISAGFMFPRNHGQRPVGSADATGVTQSESPGQETSRRGTQQFCRIALLRGTRPLVTDGRAQRRLTSDHR